MLNFSSNILSHSSTIVFPKFSLYLSLLVLATGCDEGNIKKKSQITKNNSSSEYLESVNTEAVESNVDAKTKLDAFRDFQRSFRGEN